jgi:hypothetical protein
MIERLTELLERFAVGLGLVLGRLSAEEKTMITLLLTFLMLAAAAGRLLRI